MDCRDAANRDLLIGLFALQNGLVDSPFWSLPCGSGLVTSRGRLPSSRRRKGRSMPRNGPCWKGSPSNTSIATAATPIGAVSGTFNVQVVTLHDTLFNDRSRRSDRKVQTERSGGVRVLYVC
jgi:hypothetical protein